MIIEKFVSNLKVCTNIVIKRSGWRFLTKLTIPLPCDPEIPLVEVYSREMKIHVHVEFIAVLSAVRPSRKQPVPWAVPT